jgi:DNA-directed DNA polymerase III PolC
MINITNRTEFSIRMAAGKISNVLERQEAGAPAGICDRDSTWGHVKWGKACKKAGRKSIFGVELRVVIDMELREKQSTFSVKLIAKNHEGLKEIYEANTLASEKFYYIPRIDWGYLLDMARTNNVAILLSGAPWDSLVAVYPKRKIKWPNIYFEINAATSEFHLREAILKSLPFVATQDNYFPYPEDRAMFEMVVGAKQVENRTAPMHILTQGEWVTECTRLLGSMALDEALTNAATLAEDCAMELPMGDIVKPDKPKTLRKMCEESSKRRGINLKDPVYKERFDYELRMIDEKKFEDYFYIVSDMVIYAKTQMLVGPARGSSCGSLVCYLLDITDIDPIPYGLLFERFIDVNREDYPDIDIDFADNRRELVFEYLATKYGRERVARLGTVSEFKPKSAITDVSKALGIPAWEINELKNSIVERSGGDARAALCILDTFNESEIGKKILIKYPELLVCAEMEGHARHTGMHAAGIFLSDKPVTNYCSIDERSGATQIDKYDAESLNLLKIDALGLRTLTVLQDCLEQIGEERDFLLKYPTDDKDAFKILTDHRFSGIFQFEGASLKILVSHMDISNIEDIIAATALARPGPLASGGTNEYCHRKVGKSKVEKIHPILDAITEPTFGIVIYQEQVMRVARELGKLSWGDVTNIRKAMSKSMGKEFFDKFFEKFLIGARENGLTDEVAKQVWDTINTMGSWAFNRSHAVAYGMVSYWCCVLKAHYPLEFALACLRSAKDDEQSVYILRDLVKEGFKYKPYDPKLSMVNWTAQDGYLIGGLTAIKGVGEKLALSIIEKRSGKNKKPYTKTELKALENGKTPWDEVFACDAEWGHLKKYPGRYGIVTEITDIETINEDTQGTYLVIAKLKQKKTRDANEAMMVERRGGKKLTGPTIFANLVIEDDTGEILAGIGRLLYPKLGPHIIDEAKLGDWYLIKGTVSKGFRRINIDIYKRLTDNPDYAPREAIGLEALD